jgi:large repetitive protein
MKTTLFEATLPVARCVISIISILAFTPSARGAGPDFTVAGQTLSAQQWHYYQVHLDPEHNYNGWRLSLSVTAGDGSPTMHVRKGGGASDPVTSDNSTKSGTHTVIFTEPEFTFETYYVGVYLPSGSITYTLTGRTPYFEVLEWDDGETENGVEFQAPAERSGGDHFLRIQAEASAAGAWRTVLRVLEGEADLFLSRIESPYETVESSQRTGSDGIVLHSSQYNPGGTWLIRVHASPGADWRVVSGEIHVKDLGELGCDGAGGAEKIGPEGFRFYKTTIKPQNDGCPPNVAWGLWLNGATNRILVSKSAAPLPDHSDLDQKGQMLVVPGYLATSTFDGSYFVAVVGDPDTDIVLTSKAQEISDLDFGSSTSPVVVDGFGYRTYRVQVPVEQIAWHIEAAPLEGDPNIAVRRELVPNEWNNDAYSEAAGAADSIALAPPTLSDEVFYITVYGKGPFSYVLKNGSPEITDISFESQSGIANCVLQPPGCSHAGRVGWRYYRVHDIGEQLGHLGWELLLENYAPGTEIALRRNAAPARWQYRYDQWSQTPNPGAHVDLASSFGFLQHPAHQSDIWYVGVYNPAAPLGDFTLKTLPITARDIDINDTVAMPAVPEGKWSFFRLLVSESVLGLDVRVIQVAGGNPMVVMRRDQLPNSLQTLWPRTLSGTDPWNSQSWPSGAQWAGTSDWASSYETPDVPADFHMLQMGTGNPLERGAYYIGVFNNSASRSSYTLRTRGIGTGGTIPVRDLGFAPGGPVANVASGIVAPREADYWRVDVPPGKKSWKVRLTINGAGDALLLSQKEALPNIMAGRQDPAYPGSALHMAGGIRMYQSGNEHFLLLPNAGSSTIDIGNYYLVVANSEKGDGPLSSYTLESLGELAVTDLGVLRSDGCAASAPEQELQAGEVFAYSFSALPDTSMIEARVLNAEGSPRIALRPGVQLPSAQQRDFDAYGTQGGENEYDPPYTLTGSNLISLANPSPGDHMLLVKANDGQPLKSFSVEVCSVRPMELKFDGGVTNVTHHPARSWKVFSVPVPEAAGWDIRIEDVVSGYPRLVVRRDALPMDVEDRWLGTDSGERPWEAQEWPSQSQWAGVVDWTWRYSDAAGNDAHSSMLQMGMGNPLEQGLYYVGVYNYGEEPASYKVVSRGIGMGRSIPVRPLVFSGGEKFSEGLLPRYADYYEATVPSNVSSWKVRLAHASEGGETLLLCQKGALPNVMAGRQWSGSSGSALGSSGGVRMQKTGNEHYLLLPEAGRSVIPGGKYYLAVVSEGVNPWDDRIGFDWSSYLLESLGELRPWDLGELRRGESIIAAGETLEGGEIQAYQFTVSRSTPAITAFVRAHSDCFGLPAIGMRPGHELPLATYYGQFDNYGSEGGQTYPSFPHGSYYPGATLITVANPEPGLHTLVVKANHGLDLRYDLEIKAEEPKPLEFDGGTVAVSGQAPGGWSFFVINVPQAAGWDIRLEEVISGYPRLVVRRDILPMDAGDRWLSTDAGERPWESQEWPSQSQWAGIVDWTWRYSDAAGNDAHSSMLQMGMGNPLEQGLYYVGVYNYGEEPASYKVVSRGIGMGRLAPVTLLGFSGGRVEKKALRARYADYYEVTVPSNVSSWKVRLAHASEGGETLLLCQKGALPNVMAGRQWSGSSGSALGLSGGIRMQKTGNEHYLLLPEAGRSVIPGGKYYLAVVSEGVNPWDDRIGFGSSSYVLESLGELRPWDLGELRSGGSIIAAGETLEGGEIQVYQFTMSEGALVFEARLESRVGNPQMGLAAGTGIPHAGAYPGSIFDPYGCDQGQPYAEPYSSWQSATVLTVGATPGGQQYTLVVKADATSDASYTLRISTLDIPALAFAGQSAGAYGILADKQRAFYRVTVPQSWNNAPVLGWRLGLTQTSGAASLRVRKGVLPSDLAAGTAPFTKDTAILAPPFLTPGDWYVEVISEGLTSYGLTSGAVTLERTPWAMPAAGQHVTTPGLGGSEYFADTGFDENGNPICDMPCDQGVDLERGGFHFYAVEIPNANGALLRIQLEAISGNPDLYARAGMIPTLMHAEDGHEGALYDRCLAKWSQTEYGNWVPVNGRQQTELDPGMLYLAVRAAGDSNVRYRLRLEADCASSDRIQDLDLDGGAKENQTIAAGDWRFYRVRIPLQAPKNWSVTFNQLVGDVVLHMRDTIPPGQAPNPPRSDGYDSVKDWADDNKNSGPYPTSDPYGLGVTAMDAPGAYVFSVPHIRPGSIYYLGFQAKSDATFNVSSSISEETIGDVPIMHFVTGAIASKSILPGGKLRYRIDTPADGVHLKFEFRASSERVTAYLQQGTLPAENATDHWLSTQSSQVIFEASLLEQTWPWLPGMSYYLTIANNSDVPAAADFTMLTDNDQDGLPDFWEIAMFGDTASYSAHDDPDGDGLTNLQELLLGTNPLDARTPGVFAPPTPLSDGTIALALSGEPGKQYRIEASENAGRTWSDIGTVAAGPSGNIHIDDRDAVQHAYRIYRTVLMK